MTPSKALFWFCISFIIGITTASLTKIPQIFIWGILVLGIIIIFIYLLFHNATVHKNKIALFSFFLFFFVLGITRFQMAEFNTENDPISKLNDSPEKVTLTGQVIDGPDIRNTFQKLKVKVDNTSSIILVTIGRYPEYKYLDEVKITGKLETPMITEDFNYKNYLLKDGIYSVMDFPKTELIPSKRNYNILSFSYEKVLFLKEKMKESINANYSPPKSFIMEGVILGNDKNMSQELKNKFNSAGLSHVTAVSGSNIIIITSIIMSLLLFLGFWRQQAFYFTIILIWAYVLLVGLPVSAIRAAIMGSLLLLSQKLGRQNTSSRTITMAAALMVFENPFVLFYDVGFQLSFLASMGIIHLKPLFDNLFFFIKKVLPELILKLKIKNLFDIISITLSAQIFTLPIIVYNFKSISLVAPLTNLLILPIISLLTSLGLISVILGIFSRFLGWVFYLPCWLLLGYFLKVLDIFYQPWAVTSVNNISLAWFMVYYAILSALIFYLNKRLKPKFLGY